MVGIVMLMLAGMPATRAIAQVDCTFIEEGTAWLHHEAPPPPGWNEPDLEDDPETSDWRLGCTPYGTAGCGFMPRTAWTVNSTIYLRQHVWLSGDETGLVASIAIDNEFDLHVNGSFVANLSKENCATRWDAVVPIPDDLWVAGDNLVALRIVDRGGIATFEMILTGRSASTCPPGCALLSCDAEGPVVSAGDDVVCPGTSAEYAAAATWSWPCATGLEHRLVTAAPHVLRGWTSVPEWRVLQGAGPENLVVEARCSQSPSCPRGADTGTLVPAPGPPEPLGAVLRVGKAGGLARLDWSLAPPHLPGEHDHAWLARDAGGPAWIAHHAPAGATSWLDPEPGGRAYYVVRRSDACEREGRE